MNIRQMITLLRESADPNAEPAGACLPPESLAAWLDRALRPAESAAAEAHLAACDRCLGQLVALSRAAAEQSASAGVPASLVAQAEALFTPAARPMRQPQLRWAVPLAAAAMVLLTLGLVLDSSTVPNEEIGRNRAPQTRYADHRLAQPRLLAPAEGSVVKPAEQVFQWAEVPGTLFYDVRLVSLDGDLLLRERVEGTRWLIPKSLQLEPGEAYFVRVDAYLTDSKYLSSEHREFRVAGAR